MEDVLGWPKISFGFFYRRLWENLKELLDQPNGISLQPPKTQCGSK